jgi:phosphatidylglycerophosphate synthase
MRRGDVVSKNLANLIVLVRVILVFASIALLSCPTLTPRIIGVTLLALSILFDRLDGFVAERLKIVSTTGALLDTLGDRITENLFLIFFAYKQIIPLYVPLVFAARSFLADFIRLLNFKHGLSTFAVNTSFWGRTFVSSRTSRVLYLLVKMALISAASFILIAEHSTATEMAAAAHTLSSGIPSLAGLTVAFCVLRFVLLVYDSRSVIQSEFLK